MKCKDRIREEHVLKRICLVVSKLPQNYLWESSQVELLMNFFLMNYDNFDGVNYFILTVLKRLLMSDLYLAHNYIERLFDTLFGKGQVQIHTQKERFLFYQILDILLEKYSKGDFPRSLFDVHASDLFDVVACYYPIEFNHNSKERTEITKELLVSGCESCLLVDEDFAPFVFELVIEKFLDSEYSTNTKLEAKACTVFPCSKLLSHIDQLCAGIRSILFNFPKSINDNDVPEPISAAVSAMLKTFEGSKVEDKEQRIECISREFVEKSEMFVLRTELGLTGRMLAFFEILLNCKSSFKIVFENVFSWLLLLCKGDSAGCGDNKSEMINISMVFLCHWIDIAGDFEQLTPFHMSYKNAPMFCIIAKAFVVTLLRKYHVPLFEMLNKYDREIAQLVCINLKVHTSELLEKCKVFLRKSFDCVCSQNKELRNSCLLFVHTFAVTNWTIVRDLFVDEINNKKEIFQITPLVWSLIHDIDSLDFALSYLGTLLPSTSTCTDDFREMFLEIFKSNKLGSVVLLEALLKQSLTCFFTICERSTQNIEVHSEFLQQMGLIIDERTHFKGLCLIRKKLENCSHLLPGLYLYIIQSPYNDELLNLLTQLTSVNHNFIWFKSLIMAALVNKSPNYAQTLNHVEKMRESFKFLDSFKCKARLCAALLLIDRPEGSTYFAALLRDLVQYFHSEHITALTDALIDMLIFDACYSDPTKCKYRTTFLWRQRIFCQLVPIYVNYFNDLSKENIAKSSEFQNRRIVLLPLLSPLFALAASSTAVMNEKYVELLPILCAALDTSALNLDLEEQIISSLAALLKNATAEQLGHDLLLKVLPRLQHCLENSKDMIVHIAALECLQLVAQRWSSAALLPFYGSIVRSLTKTSGSQKRIVRTTVANVRNLW
ncbi:unnamed protein product [Litomosoides sigmodontis]|uniref:MMS19 nucleotide excision repair protein n=1 Tax=Litomosoides sigmodontis TaxID=42156 RepID=A0A3P6UZ95_LITSI|nr:unnamed protein product [Litomosoides sigmodontis]